MTKAKVLLADDDRLVLVTLSNGLRKAGYDILEASSGEEALVVCEEHQPDLAILDIRMPGLSGIETAQKFNCDYNLPFLMLSAYSDDELVKEAVSVGALGYLVKPLDVPQIVPTIEAALERSSDIGKLKNSEFHLNRALHIGRNTSTAVGLLMERYRLTSENAFDMLRRHARSQRRKVIDVATDIVAAAEAINIQTPPKSN